MKIARDRGRLAAVLVAAVVVGGCTGQPKPPVPEPAAPKAGEPTAAATKAVAPDRAKGDEILKAMSTLLAETQNFTFATDEVHKRSGANGQPVERKFSRELAVRRPDAVWFRSQGDREGQVWYADKKLTVVSDKNKTWAQAEVPATLDEAMDDIAARFDILMPMADLLYSSPWDAYMSAESTGGWMGVETIGGKQCHHIAYSQPVVDWELWIAEGAEALPCRLAIVYKNEPGPPRSDILFRDWNRAANSPADRFVAAIPQGYERIDIVERVPASEDASADTSASVPAAPAATATVTPTEPSQK